MRKWTVLMATLLVFVSGSVVSGGPRLAQQGRFAGIQITPASFERDLDARDFRIRMAVVNNDPIPRDVELSVARLGHDLDGTPLFIRPSHVQTHVSLSEESLSLGIGERVDVLIEGSIPEAERSIYPAVVAQFAEGTETASVSVRARVAGFLLLRGPQPWDERIAIEDVSALPPEQPRDRTVTLYAAVRNIGNVHVRPTGFIDVVKDGRVLDRVRLTGETIIPEFARRLVGRWTPPRGLIGAVELRAELRNPSARATDILELGSDLATASIENLLASGESGGSVSLFVANTGTSTISPTVSFEATEDGEVRAAHEQVERDIEPGDARELRWFAGLDDGLYTTTVTVAQSGRVLDESVTGFEVVTPGILRWIALVLLVSVTIAHTIRIRRRGSLF